MYKMIQKCVHKSKFQSNKKKHEMFVCVADAQPGYFPLFNSIHADILNEP